MHARLSQWWDEQQVPGVYIVIGLVIPITLYTLITVVYFWQEWVAVSLLAIGMGALLSLLPFIRWSVRQKTTKNVLIGGTLSNFPAAYQRVYGVIQQECYMQGFDWPYIQIPDAHTPLMGDMHSVICGTLGAWKRHPIFAIADCYLTADISSEKWRVIIAHELTHLRLHHPACRSVTLTGQLMTLVGIFLLVPHAFVVLSVIGTAVLWRAVTLLFGRYAELAADRGAVRATSVEALCAALNHLIEIGEDEHEQRRAWTLPLEWLMWMIDVHPTVEARIEIAKRAFPSQRVAA